MSKGKFTKAVNCCSPRDPNVGTSLEGIETTASEKILMERVKSGNVDEVKDILKGEQVQMGAHLTKALMIAAEADDYHMTKLLTDHGLRLKKPKPTTGYKEDISTAAKRVKLYKAASSPAYICCTSSDPLMKAFRMCRELREVCRGIGDLDAKEIKPLIERLEEFTLQLLRQCDNNNEVKSLLHGNGKWKRVAWKRDMWVVAREVMEYKQKKFAADVNYQRVLRSVWMDGQPEWADKHGFFWAVLYFMYCVLVYGALQPLLAMIHIFYPCSPFANVIKSPKGSLIMHMFAYGVFVALILRNNLVSFYGSLTITTEGGIIIFWTAALLLGEILQAINLGFCKYISDFWNIVDILMLTTCLCVFILNNCYLCWYATDYTAYAFLDGLVACILTAICLRCMQYFFLHKALGSMLVTFVGMKKDVFYFFCIFITVVLSFSLGLYFLYTISIGDTNIFALLHSNIETLIWAIFGKESTEHLEIPSPTESYNDIYDLDDEIKTINMIYVNTGYILYGLFSLISLLILLNLCIAMMSDTYTKIQENIDVEWTFARTSIWMDFILGPVLPAPFNVFVTMGFIFGRINRCIMGVKKCCKGTDMEAEFQTCEDSMNYNTLLSNLIAKYFEERQENNDDGDIGKVCDDDPSALEKSSIEDETEF